MAEQATAGPDLSQLQIDRPPSPARRRSRGWLTPALTLAALAVPATYALHRYAAARLPVVQTATAAVTGPGNPGVVLTASGYVVTRHKYIVIGTKVLGQIVAEPIEEGQHVKRGEVLARIDDRDYRAQLRQAEASREVAAANLRLALAKAERARQVMPVGAISRDDYETAESAAEVARATLHSTAAAVDYAGFMVSQCTIRSPIDGVVLQKYREVGDTINYGGALQAGGGATDIAQLADTADMRAEVDINEGDIAKVALGSRAQVVLDAYPERRFDATLVKIYPEADRQKGTVKVEVRLTQPDLAVTKAEMGTKVSFVEPEVSPTAPVRSIVVPKSAVRTAGGSSYVWVVRDAAVHSVHVERGPDTETGVEITKGLSGDERLVTASAVPLSEGLKVKSE